MATFSQFNDRLPDPTFGVNDAGVVDPLGVRGPGFASVTMASSEDTQVSRTISGRGVHRTTASQFWRIGIRYNPMTREQFDVVDTFLQARKGRKTPFFVVLPQYAQSKNPTFAAYSKVQAMRFLQPTAAGNSSFLMYAPPAGAIVSPPRPGDFFTISDPNNINHMKAYKVTRIETSEYYQSGKTQPPAATIRVHTNPPLERFVNADALVNWVNPRFRVMLQGDVIEHELGTENTYEFGLNLEEIQP